MLTQDPIGLAGGVNLYAFPGNNPIAFSDPFGLGPCEKEEDKNACTLAQEVYNQILNWLNGPKGRVAGALADALRTVANALRRIPGVENGTEAVAGIDFDGTSMSGQQQVVAFGMVLGETAGGGAGKVVAGKITGFTKHGINSAISHDGLGVSGRALRDAVANPIKTVQQSGGKTLYIGQNAGVVLNRIGEVITTWARNHLGWRNAP